MYQKFFTNTIMSDFVKSLVYNSPLPVFDYVDDGQFIVKGCRYIYKTNIIECTRTGYIFGDYTPPLYPDNSLFPDENLYPGTGLSYAEFIVVGTYTFGDYNSTFTEKYKSQYNYYDSKTHVALGKLLRCIRAFYRVDLMPFYNCFNHTEVEDLILTDEGEIETGTNSAYKTYAIPIKFNQTYTIAVDCDSRVVMKSVLYGPLGLLRHGVSKNSPTWMSSLQETSTTTYEFLHFKKPVSYRINSENKELIDRQKYLYLLLRLPVTNTSTITVLEGDYTFCGYKIFNKEYLSTITAQEFNNLYLSPLGLLQLNDKNSYAFSDVFIQYLLLNVITSMDDITDNIVRVQEYIKNIGKKFPQYVWRPTTSFVKKGINITGVGNTPQSMGLIPQPNSMAYNEVFREATNQFLLEDLELMTLEELGPRAFFPAQMSWATVNVNDYYLRKTMLKQTTKSIWDIYMRDIIFDYYRRNGRGPFIDVNGFVTRDVEKELVKITTE